MQGVSEDNYRLYPKVKVVEKMFKRLILLVLTIFAVIVGAEWFLPPLLAGVVTEALKSTVNSRELSADLTKTPAILMLGGKFDRIVMNAADIKIDELLVQNIDVSMTDIELDLAQLFRERKVGIKDTGEIKLSAVITQEELAKYLNTSVKGVRDASVLITPEKTVVGSEWTIGGLAKIDLKLEGQIISDNQKIKFIPKQFLLNSSSVNTSSLFGGSLMSEIVILDSNKLPFGVAVRDIVAQEGKVVINADNIL